jgi:hypothetical protein
MCQKLRQHRGLAPIPVTADDAVIHMPETANSIT